MSAADENALENAEQCSGESLAPNTEPDAGDLMIRVCDVWKSFGDSPVLKGISLEVKAHETVGIIGLSGCGKSTLLRIISGLETADRGEIHLADPNYSLVFQYSALFDSLTIFENVAFSLMEKPDVGSQRLPETLQSAKARSGRYRMKQIREIVAEKLKMVGLEGIEEQYPSSLSGGMKKRVSFARAIVSNPRIILYDEPTAGLDPIASTVIEDYMVQMRNELNAASMVVTHQFSTINRTDRLILLHEGEVCWEGTPKELYNSSNPFAHQFANASLDGPMTQENP